MGPSVLARAVKTKALRKRAGGSSKWEGLHLMGGDEVDARALALETLRFCLREEGGRASEWYNDDAQLGASIGAACSARQACAAWPAGHMKLLRIASCSTRELMQLAELDLTSAAAQGQVGPGVGGALAVLVASSKALRRLDVGGSAIGKEGAAALAIALRRNRTLTSIALDGHPLPLRHVDSPHTSMFEKEQVSLSRMGLGPLSAVIVGTLLEGNSTLRSLNLYRNQLVNISGLARALSEATSALISLVRGSFPCCLPHIPFPFLSHAPTAGHTAPCCMHTDRHARGPSCPPGPVTLCRVPPTPRDLRTGSRTQRARAQRWIRAGGGAADQRSTHGDQPVLQLRG